MSEVAGVCLDATYCIDFLQGREAAIAKAHDLEGEHASLAIPVPAAMEVLLWGRRHGDKALRRTLDLIERVEVLDSTLEVAQEASRLGLECERRGAMVPNMDLLIAATARVHRKILVTRDSDFHRVAGLTLESY